MLQFEKYTLDNGLKVILHQDITTTMAVVNVLYQVGAKHEDPGRTGFAHLFEHLMFGGSENIPEFDEPLQRAGGTNNAWTNNDLTNYYDIIPAQNLEVALWLESDRMKRLDFNQRSLDVQKKVVVEEFKENYLNQPYGDAWFHIREMAYKKHPYRWPTIGLKPKHIEEAQLNDVVNFFEKYYCPNNAILVIAGNFDVSKTKRLVKKWFDDIASGSSNKRTIPTEPKQTASREKTVKANVPANRLYKAFHMDARVDEGYYAADMITDVMGLGKASRLYQTLVKEKKLFSNMDAYITGSVENGLLMFQGQLMPNIRMKDAEKALQREIDKLKSISIENQELEKIKNIKDTQNEMELTRIANQAFELAYFEHLGNAALINSEKKKYQSVTAKDIQLKAQEVLVSENSCTLHYLSATAS